MISSHNPNQRAYKPTTPLGVGLDMHTNFPPACTQDPLFVQCVCFRPPLNHNTAAPITNAKNASWSISNAVFYHR